MDHWGDPWADSNDANETLSPTRPTVTTPRTATSTKPAPLLNSYWDDAGWGNEGEGAEILPSISNDHWDTANSHLENPIESELVVSEPSDTSTTIQQDDDDSVHASTSPSEVSHAGLSVESSRTSFEDDKGATKSDTGHDSNPLITQTDVRPAQSSRENGSPQQPLDVVKAVELPEPQDHIEEDKCQTEHVKQSTSRDRKPRPIAVAIDPDLLSSLFPPAAAKRTLLEAPDDPIYSTSSRKAWYRLTRRQTLREFNAGQDQDNYVRITWTSSTIRSEVNKIVGRWAREDRISGTGPGARASFYWDTPLPDGPIVPRSHARHQSVMQVTAEASAPNRQSLPPMSIHVPAAFNWSSASPEGDPWHTSSPVLPSGSRNTCKQSIGTSPNEQYSSGASKDSSFGRMESGPTGPLPKPQNPFGIAPQKESLVADLDVVESTSPTSSKNPFATSLDKDKDEDEWGDMVSSPQNSTPITPHFLLSSTPFDSVSNIPSLSSTQRSVSATMNLAETVSESPVVRLKSTVSPTSAVFRKKAFVPLHFEDGPIGPHLLKRATDRSASGSLLHTAVDSGYSPAEQSRTDYATESSARRSSVDVVQDPSVKIETVSESLPTATLYDDPSSTTTHDAGGWADVDFSFFETRSSKVLQARPPVGKEQPPVTTTSQIDLQQHQTSAPEPSAKSTKDEAEEAFRRILNEIPDLSYMLV